MTVQDAKQAIMAAVDGAPGTYISLREIAGRNPQLPYETMQDAARDLAGCVDTRLSAGDIYLRRFEEPSITGILSLKWW